MSDGRPPVARRVDTWVTLHGHTRLDPYAWIRDDARKNADVLAYLEAENSYTKQMMKPTEALQERLFQEIKNRVKETDLSVPYRRRGYYYYTRTEEGQQYAILCRKAGSLDGTEEVYLDQNALALGHAYFDLGDTDVSLDGRYLAYSTDTDGSETYNMVIRDLEADRLEEDRIENMETVAWAGDGQHLFYTVRDAAKRPYRIYRHRMGTAQSTDELIYEEPDPLYNAALSRTRDDVYLLIGSTSSTTSEWRILEARAPTGPLRLIEPRQVDHEYDLDHHDGTFFIRTNSGARNFRVVTTPESALGRAHWTEILPGRPGVKVDDIDAFKDFWVAWEREQGLSRIRITRFADGATHYVDFPEAAYAVFGSGNAEFDTPTLRFNYQSLIQPPAVFDYEVATRQRTLLKQTEVLGGYDPTQYVTERVMVPTYDGLAAPLALVYRRDVPRDGSAPLLLYAYGSYGIPMDPTFSHARLSLLDRGVVYALAQVRGGGELGEEWHDQGKMMFKRNTFADFIGCAEWLITHRYTSSRRLAIGGGSAGGLLIGAVVNMRPDLFRVALAKVPFVDVLNTMLDDTLPLTTGEYLEWGNPSEAAAYHYMKTYCPYTNIAPQRYPALLVTAGLNDPRVGYWEAAKFVAKLRSTKLDDNVLLLRTNLGAGHAGASGRYDAWKEVANDYAFLLRQLEIHDPDEA